GARSGGNDVGPRGGIAPARGARVGQCLARGGAPLVQIDSQRVEVQRDRRDVRFNDSAQLRARRERGVGGNALDINQQPAHAALEYANQQLLLASDVVVQAALVQADRGGDVLHRRSVVALLTEQPQRRGIDLLCAVGRGAGR